MQEEAFTGPRRWGGTQKGEGPAGVHPFSWARGSIPVSSPHTLGQGPGARRTRGVKQPACPMCGRNFYPGCAGRAGPGADAYHTLNTAPGPVRLPKTLLGGSASSVFWSPHSERFRDLKQLAQGHTASKKRAETDFQSLCLSEFQTGRLVMSPTAQAVQGSSLWWPCLHASSHGELTFSQNNMSLGRT